ncbi:MAG: glycosyltransferase family 2 protein [Lachnospiraceae bacterium]
MQNSKKPRVMILLTCYNRREKTLSCIKSIGNQNPSYDLTFVVTDDNSRDNTVPALRELPYQFVFLKGDGKLFWNGGMRKALDYALEHLESLDYVMLINDDVVFFPNMVDNLYHRLMENEAEVVVGATKTAENTTSYGGVLMTSRHFAKYRLVDPSPSPVYCDTFNGNCVFMSSEIFRQVGNLDEHYIHSMSDYDYGMSIRRKGFRIINTKDYVGVCEDNAVEGSWRDTSLPRKKRMELKEGPKGLPKHDWYYFIKKNYGFIPACYHSITPYLRILLGK